MKSTMMDPSRRPVVIVAALVVLVGLGLLYSFHRQNNQLLDEHQSIQLRLQKCERHHQQCSSDVTICVGQTIKLRATNGETAKQLKQAQEEATAVQKELEVFKTTGADMKRELDTARRDLVARESTLADTGTKLSEAESFSKMVIAAVDSNVDQNSTLSLSQQLVNSTVDKINAMKTEIETLKRKIAEIAATSTRSAPKAKAAPAKPADDVKATAAPKAAATEASATEADTESVATESVATEPATESVAAEPATFPTQGK